MEASKTPNPEPVLYSPAGAAMKLGCGTSTIYVLMDSGELESVKLGRSRRITAASIDRYVAKLIAAAS